MLVAEDSTAHSDKDNFTR